MIVLDLNPEDRQHLKQALGTYVAFLRIHGESWPGVTSLLAALRDGPGQERPTPTSDDQDRHAAGGSQRDALLAPDAAAEVLGISVRTLRRRVADGEIPSVRFGRTVRFDPQDLRDYVERIRT